MIAIELTQGMDPLTDKEIIEYLQSGQASLQNKAFRFLYRNHFGLIESLVLTNTGTKDDSKDIFQDGLIVFFNSVLKGTFKAQSSIKTYIYSVCRNLWLMKLKRKKRETPLEDKHEKIQVQEDLFKTLEHTEQKRLILKLLRELGEDCRKIIILFYYRKLKMEEIRTTLSMKNEQVAKNKKSRCMRRIRSKVLDGGGYWDGLR